MLYNWTVWYVVRKADDEYSAVCNVLGTGVDHALQNFWAMLEGYSMCDISILSVSRNDMPTVLINMRTIDLRPKLGYPDDDDTQEQGVTTT